MSYFTEFTSKSALAGSPRLNQLPKQLPPASSWGRNEISAFRVVNSPTNARILPRFANKRDVYNNLTNSNTALLGLVQPTPSNLPTHIETDLAIRYGPTLGQFWAALADILAGKQDGDLLDLGGLHAGPMAQDDIASSPEQPPSKRIRKSVEHQNMVNSTQVRFGSSSPYQASSQVSSADEPFIPLNSGLDEAREIKTERLMTCFFRHILYAAPYEKLGLRNRLECRTSLFARVFTEGGWCIQAEDDGGLRWRERMFLEGGEHIYARSQRSDCYYTLFEAKKRFQQIREGRPIISDAWLGQMTAEALAGRLARKADNSDPK